MNITSLDIGCGYLPDHKRRQGIGIDVQRGTCNVVADACHIPFQDEAFSDIQARNILEHVSNPFPLLREINRVLTPQGRCYITIPIFHNPCIDELVKVCFGFPVRLPRTVKRLIRWTRHRRKSGFWHLNRVRPIDICASRTVRVVRCTTRRPKHDLLEGRKGKIFQRLGLRAHYPPDVYFLLVSKR